MAAATAQGSYINPMAALASQIPHSINGKQCLPMSGGYSENELNCMFNAANAGSGQPGVNGSIPSLPSPTMPTFNMAAQTPNGQPNGNDSVYSNGALQPYQGREYPECDRELLCLVLFVRFFRLDIAVSV